MNDILKEKILEADTAIAQWLEAEISRSAYICFLHNLPLLEQGAQLQEMGYQYRIYPDGSHHWGRISPDTNEWFDISVFRVDVTSC
jgi:hypothetical protein